MLSGFCDLNIYAQNSGITDICKALVELGYKAAAVNYTLKDTIFEPKKKKKKGEIRDDIVPTPADLNLPEDVIKHLRILRRLTVSFSEPQQLHKLIDDKKAAWNLLEWHCLENVTSSENAKKYDLLAVMPTTQSAFQYACSTLNADLICFDAAKKPGYRFSRKMYNVAVKRNMFFEISYVPAIADSSARKNTIHTSHQFHVYGKSKNVIISSGASRPLHVRGPYDIVNLGLLFGLSEAQSRSALTTSCWSAVKRAELRRQGKVVMQITSVVDDWEEPSPALKRPRTDTIQMDVDA